MVYRTGSDTGSAEGANLTCIAEYKSCKALSKPWSNINMNLERILSPREYAFSSYDEVIRRCGPIAGQSHCRFMIGDTCSHTAPQLPAGVLFRLSTGMPIMTLWGRKHGNLTNNKLFTKHAFISPTKIQSSAVVLPFNSFRSPCIEVGLTVNIKLT